MENLFQRIMPCLEKWRLGGYSCDRYETISEILEWTKNSDIGGFRFLRRPQFWALETYWYLRLIERTPHIFDLYNKLYNKQSELLSALGLDNDKIKAYVLDESFKALIDRVKTDDSFVRDFKLESLRETLTLAYPSYIFALAMGAGKTVLIGAIIATEFAMSLEYPEGPFVKNALVFAPGKTIIESLRELVPFQPDFP